MILTVAARALLARRPEAWVYAVAGVAGAVWLAQANPNVGIPKVASWSMAWCSWMLMVLAMMLPVVAPQARQLALRSLWFRRHRAIAGFLSGYLTVWAAIGVTIVGALHAAGQPHPPVRVTVGALLGAALWQTSARRRRVMRRCGSVRVGAAKGFAADVDCAGAGWRAGWLCVFTCGPVMLAMAVGHHYPVLMVALAVLLLTERARGPNPHMRAGRAFEAWCLVSYAALISVATIAQS